MGRRTLALLPLLASSLGAQFSGPSLGLVYDASSQALRRISGLPGGATLSDPVLPGLISAAIAPDRSFAIVNDGAGYRLFTAGGLRDLPDGLPAAARIVFSPSGAVAAFYIDNSFTLVTGLPAQPALQTVAAPGVPGQFAVSDAGALLMSIAQDAAGESIVEIPPQSQPVHLLDLGQASAIVFSRDGTQAWVADGARNAVWSLQHLDAAPSTTQIASATDGLTAPLALAVSPDSQRLWIANGQGANILTFDLSQNMALASTVCACKPTALAPLASAGVFAVTDLATGPMWIFDASPAVPQTLFIPGVSQ